MQQWEILRRTISEEESKTPDLVEFTRENLRALSRRDVDHPVGVFAAEGAQPGPPTTTTAAHGARCEHWCSRCCRRNLICDSKPPSLGLRVDQSTVARART